MTFPKVPNARKLFQICNIINNIEYKKDIKIIFDLKFLFRNNLGIKRYLKNNSL